MALLIFSIFTGRESFAWAVLFSKFQKMLIYEKPLIPQNQHFPCTQTHATELKNAINE
jgi:hypothetical protein